jgi:hypothetical protein
MERTVTPGDIATFITQDGSGDYVITSIDNGYIKTPLYNIMNINDEWKVIGLTEPHTITFKSGVMNIRDLTKEIARHLPTRDVLNFCLTSTYQAEICNDDRFWKDRVIRDLGEILYKPVSMTFYEYYIAKSLSMKDVATIGRIDLARLLEKLDKEMDSHALAAAKIASHAEFVSEYNKSWNTANDQIFINDIISYAIKNGDISLLSEVDIPLPQLAMNMAAAEGQLPVLIYLYNKYHEVPESHTLIDAMVRNDTPVVSWLREKGVTPKSDSAFLSALRSGNFEIIKYCISFIDDRSLFISSFFYTMEASKSCTPEILEWLTHNRFILYLTMHMRAAGQATPDTLEWLYRKGYNPSTIEYLYAFEKGRDQSLEWLFDHNVPIEDVVIHDVISLDKIKYLDWLESHGVDFTSLENLTIAHSVETQKWLLQRGIIPNDEDLNYMAEGKYHEVIKYLWDIGIKHSDMIEIIDLVVSRHELDMIKWVISRGYKLHEGHLFLAADSVDCLDTLELVYRNISHKHLITKQSIVDKSEIFGLIVNDLDPLRTETRPAILEWIQYHNISY